METLCPELDSRGGNAHTADSTGTEHLPKAVLPTGLFLSIRLPGIEHTTRKQSFL